MLIILFRHVKDHVVKSSKAHHTHPHYKKEKHSLQGKHGKTHAVC
jgi:glutamate decarboxylase